MNNLDSSDIPLKYKNAFVKAALNDSRMRGAGLSNAEMNYGIKQLVSQEELVQIMIMDQLKV